MIPVKRSSDDKDGASYGSENQRKMLNLLMAICAIGVSTIAYIQYQSFSEYQELKSDLESSAIISEHCRIMRAMGQKSESC